ncbi:MAG: hypothetical protein ACON39_00180 [Coraliomargaritaceae bacterium]
MPSIGKIQAGVSPEGDGHQVSYELGDSRRTHHFPRPPEKGEQTPHSAGSFHDPEQHRRWMDRVEAMILKQKEQK